MIPGLPGRRRPGPVAVVAFALTPIVIVMCWSIWRHRALGALDADEAAYLSETFRLRELVSSPLSFARHLASSSTSPVVPALGVPFLVVGGDVRSVLFLQPILLALTCLGITAITARLTGPRAAVITGLTFAFLPNIQTAAYVDWFGLAAGACAVAAIWALLTSDGGTNRRIWWFGVFLGVMTLSRTMTVAFLPAFLAGALVLTGRNRRALSRTAAALALGVVVAVPWWIVNGGRTFRYLVGFGYGDLSTRLASGGAVDRVMARVGQLFAAGGVATAAVLIGGVALIARRGSRTGRSGIGTWLRREEWAIAAIAFGSFAALASSPNPGGWFELPVVAIAAPLAASTLARLPRRPNIVVVALCAAQGLLVFAGLALWVLPAPVDRMVALSYEQPFGEIDPRFRTEHRSDQPAAAHAWWRLAVDTVDVMRRCSEASSPPVFSVVGNMNLWNVNALLLTQQVRQQTTSDVSGVDTLGGPDAWRDELTPSIPGSGGRRERILVAGLHDFAPFTLDDDTRGFLDAAKRSGWSEVSRLPMPVAGDVIILRHRSVLDASPTPRVRRAGWSACPSG